MRTRLIALSFIITLAAIEAVLPAAPARAHDALASTTPPADTALRAPVDTISLTFNEAPLAGLTTGLAISVTAPDGTEATSGSVQVDTATLTKALHLDAAGTYTVRWRSVSTDGHPVSGDYQFTFTGQPTPPSPAATTSSSATVAPSPAPTSGETTAAAAAAEPDRTSAVWVIGGLTGLFILAIVGILVMFSKRRNTTA